LPENVTEIANIKNYGMEYKYRTPEIKEVTLSSSDDESSDDSDEDEDKIVHSARREKIIDVME
jgi:hypothetical protein